MISHYAYIIYILFVEQETSNPIVTTQSPCVAFDMTFYPIFESCDEIENDFLLHHEYNIFKVEEEEIETDDMSIDTPEDTRRDGVVAEVTPTSDFYIEDLPIVEVVDETESIAPGELRNSDHRIQSDSTIVSHPDTDDEYPMDVETNDMAIIVGQSDVLLGRGGHCAHHEGNRLFLQERDRLHRQYRNAHGNVTKRSIQTQLLQYVYNRNGRFLQRMEYHENGITWEYWQVVTEARQIYKKAAQALREGAHRGCEA